MQSINKNYKKLVESTIHAIANLGRLLLANNTSITRRKERWLSKVTMTTIKID